MRPKDDLGTRMYGATVALTGRGKSTRLKGLAGPGCCELTGCTRVARNSRRPQPASGAVVESAPRGSTQLAGRMASSTTRRVAECGWLCCRLGCGVDKGATCRRAIGRVVDFGCALDGRRVARVPGALDK